MPREDTQFRSGSEWNGNAAGRPKGSKNKLSEDFLQELYVVFQESGGEAIRRMCAEHPSDFVRVLAGLVPKELLLEVAQEEKTRFVISDMPHQLTTQEWFEKHGLLNPEPAMLENKSPDQLATSSNRKLDDKV